MNSSGIIELRKNRQRYPDGALLNELEKKPGAFYIDFQDQCPLTHTSHRVGRNYKLCSPIISQCANNAYLTKREYPRPSRYSKYSRSPFTTSPYDPRHYNFHL